MKKIIATFMLIFGVITSTAVLANETVLREQDGSTTIVRTINGQTEVERNGVIVYRAGGDRHDEQVDYSKRQGAVVTSHSN